MNSFLVGNSTSAVDFLKTFAHALDVVDLANHVLKDWRFPLWSGSSKPHQHHYGKGGLAIHTAEVAKLCIDNNRLFGKIIPEKHLFLTALFHDAGKMWDYEPITIPCPESETPAGKEKEYQDWQGTAHKRHIHHISRSAFVWNEAASKSPIKGLHQGVIDEILHAILAQHGQREHGSPVSPNTKLAWMLHLCDGISARMDDAERWDRYEN